jgi:hypothetical protein
MAVTINWMIEALERKSLDGGVTVAFWRAIATDENVEQATHGRVMFTPDASAEGFVPFADLTEDVVLSWVWPRVDKSKIEEWLLSKIDEQKNPAVLTGTPW